MKVLEKRDKKKFYEVNEFVAKTSPMRTHYESSIAVEKWIWGKKKQLVTQMLQKIEYKSVIDIGCGDGGLYHLVNKKSKYVGIDVSPTQLADFKKMLPKNLKNPPKLVEGDVSNLPFKNNSFDAALVCDVLEHVIDPIKVMKEIRRVVKKNGYVVFNVPNEQILQLTRLISLRFPLRSPDHIYALNVEDVKKYFPKIIMHKGIPFPLSANLNLFNVLLAKNEKE